MKKLCCNLSLLFLLINSSFAQNPLVKQWDYRYGGSNWDILGCMQQTKDGGYIMGGSSYSPLSGDKTQALIGIFDYWIVKVDASGIKQWDKNFGGTCNDYLTSIQQTTDGGYILGGFSCSPASGDKTQASKCMNDYWIIKIDALGNKQWDRDFGGTDTTCRCVLNSVSQTTDKGYILGGYSSCGVGGDKTQPTIGGDDYWIIKIDALGNKQWDRDFGGTGLDDLYDIKPTFDGGYIMGGNSASGISGDKSQATKGGYDWWIVKVDSNGNKKWDRDFGSLGVWVFGRFLPTSDSGYILCGSAGYGISGDKTKAGWGQYDFWIIKIDSLGIKKWDKDFGGTRSEEDFGNITQTSDGGFLIAGTSYSSFSGDKTENNLGPEQSWIIKVDALWNKQWDKTLHTNRIDDDEIGFAFQAQDGCYVMANSTQGGIGGDKTQNNRGSYDDFWIIKFCDTTSASIVPPQSNFLASDTVLCANDCINFTNQSTNATSYQWFFTGGSPASSTDQNPHICYLTGGSYDVKLIALNGSAKDSLTFSNYIHVKPVPPTPVITLVGNTLYCSTDPSYVVYQWYDSMTIIPGATDTFLVISHSGNYNLSVSNSDSCKISVGINVILGITNNEINNTLYIFPNPITSSSTLQFNKWLSDAEVVIFDVVGKEVIRRRINGRLMELGKESLMGGVYYMSVRDREGLYIQKLVVE